MSSPADAPVTRPGRRLLPHVAIHVFLVLAYFLPGGLIWNHIDPDVFSVPFAVLMTAVVLPLCFGVNMLVNVIRHWSEDRLVTSEVRRAFEQPTPTDEKR